MTKSVLRFCLALKVALVARSGFGAVLAQKDVDLGALIASCSGSQSDIDVAMAGTLSKQLANRMTVELNITDLKAAVKSTSAEGLLLQYKKMECVENILIKIPPSRLQDLKESLSKTVSENGLACRNARESDARKNANLILSIPGITPCRRTFDLSLLLGALQGYDPNESVEARSRKRDDFLQYQREVARKEQPLIKSADAEEPPAR